MIQHKNLKEIAKDNNLLSGIELFDYLVTMVKYQPEKENCKRIYTLLAPRDKVYFLNYLKDCLEESENCNIAYRFYNKLEK